MFSLLLMFLGFYSRFLMLLVIYCLLL